MSQSISLPDQIYRKAEELASTEKVLVDELVSAVLAEQFAAREYLQRRAARASRERFLTALDQVPNLEPENHDRV